MLFGFVIAHMVGNLQVYLGRERLNAYAEKLRRCVAAALWHARLGLLVAVGPPHLGRLVAHPHEPDRAPASATASRRTRESTYASRTMRWSGVILLLFIVYHLLHFTFGNAHPELRARATSTTTSWSGFQSPLVSGFYIVAMLALGLHLYHGVWSMLQTLGLSHPALQPTCATPSPTLVTVVVVVGNISFPVAVLTGPHRTT